MFDLYKDNRDAALGFLAGNISPGKPLNFGESVEAAWTAHGAYQMSVSKENAKADVIGGLLSAYKDATGEDLNQTVTMTPDGLADTGATFAMPSPEQMRQRYEQTRAQRPDLKLAPFPDDQTIETMALDRMRAARIHYDAAQERGMSGLGDFIGTAASSLRDPINAASMAFGAGAASGILRTALIEGGINMGSQAAVVAATYDTRRKIDPNYTFDQAMYEVAAAGVGGAVIGGTLKGLVKLFEGVDRAKLPRPVNDALNVASAEAKATETNPFPGSAVDAAKHRELLDTVTHQLETNNEPITLPEGQTPFTARQAEATQALTRDLSAPLTPEQFDAAIQKRSVSLDPELFTKAGAIDQDITQVRARLDEIKAQREAAAPQLQGVDARVAELEQQLSQITGKRRSSPKAQALRDEIAQLKATPAAIQDETLARLASDEQMLRLRLVEKINDRARLGPDINAVRQRALEEADKIGMAPGAPDVRAVEAPVRIATPEVQALKAEIDKLAADGTPPQQVDALRKAVDESATKVAEPAVPVDTPSAAAPAPPREPPTPGLSADAIRETAATPQVADAAAKLAQDLADKASDEGRVLMTHVDDSGAAIPLTQVLREVEDEQNLASEIAACAIGKAEGPAP